MLLILIAAVSLALAIAAVATPRLQPYRPLLPAISVSSLLGCLALASLHYVPEGQVGHLTRTVFGDPPPSGHILAGPDQKGPQRTVLSAGLHARPLLQWLYKVENLPLVTIPSGQFGVLTAKDGAPLPSQLYLAPAWPAEERSARLDAGYFLDHGGYRGTQLTVLPPGQYPINRYLFDVSLRDALEVSAGEVAVIKSNVSERDDCPTAGTDQRRPSLVPRGCVGVWDTPLSPGRYFLNHLAYQATLIPTRAQVHAYSGGYVRQSVDLERDAQGQRVERISDTQVPVPDQAVGAAIVVNIEGWRVPLDTRVVSRIQPQQAPRLVAMVGDADQLEQVVLGPALRSYLRDVAEGFQSRLMDLVHRREHIEQQVTERLAAYTRDLGVTIEAVRLDEPALPGELLAVRQRQELAKALMATYRTEEQAQQGRVATEKARAMADQQQRVVSAELDVQVAELSKAKAQKEGEAEKLRQLELIQAQQAQVAVLGRDATLQMNALKTVLNAAQASPDIVKSPMVLVQGDSLGLAGPAAILGAGNLLQRLQELPATGAGRADDRSKR